MEKIKKNAGTSGVMSGWLAAFIRGGGNPPTAEDDAETKRLQLRLLPATQIAAVLLIVATATMAVARYL